MSSLIEEYRKRHNIECVWPMNEGLLFLELNGDPYGIALTSSNTKGRVACSACRYNPTSIILEIYVPASRMTPVVRSDNSAFVSGCSLSLVSHVHIPPDCDVMEYVRLHVPNKNAKEIVPYVSKGERDQERWIWTYFNLISRVGPDRRDFQKELQSGSYNWMSHAFMTMKLHPTLFREFYEGLYQICMVNRKYLLVG